MSRAVAAPERLRCRSRWQRPAGAFAWLAASFGLGFALLTPPLQAPDEVRHLARAFVLSEGQLLAVELAGGSAGVRVPRSIVRMDRRLGAQIAGRPTEKQHLGRLLAEFSVPLDPELRIPVRPPSLYSPLPYLPQTLGVALGRLFGLPPVAMLYLGRLANLAAWTTLMALAIRTLPAHRWLLALLALTPMSLFLAASLSPDALTNAFAFLLVARVLQAARPDAGRIAPSEVALLALLGGLVGLCKQVYLPLVGAALIVPRQRFSGSGHRLVCLSLWILGSTVPVAAWGLWVGSLQVEPVSPGADPAAQIRTLVEHPLAIPALLARTASQMAGPWLHTFVGVLGWLDTRLPSWIYVCWPVVLLAVALLDGGRASPVGARARALLLATATVTWVAVLLGAYVGWNAVGAGFVKGVQGRYFLPFAALPLLAVHLPGARGLPRWARRALPLSCAAVLAVALARLVARYYVA